MARRATLLGLLGTVGTAMGLSAQSASGAEQGKSGKRYTLAPASVGLLASGQGGVASDKVTVDGRPIGYIYRTPPINPADSGWNFMAGDEDDLYMDDANNFAVFDISSIAKLDPAVAPYLQAKVGSAFYRKDDRFIADPLGPPNVR